MDAPEQNLLPLEHLTEDLLSNVYSMYDVPEMLQMAGVSKAFLELITGNDKFIKGYNLRERPEMWSVAHLIKKEFEPFGVLVGTRLSDEKRLIVPISLKNEVTSLDLLDTAGSFALFTLGKDSHRLFVLNLFGQDAYIEMPALVSTSILDSSHVLHIKRSQETFCLVYGVVSEENVPSVLCYDSNTKSWHSITSLPLGTDLGNQIDLESGSTLFLESNDQLYTLCVFNGCYYHALQPLIKTPSLPKTVYKTAYVGCWAVQLKLDNSLGSDCYPTLLEIILYERTDIFSKFALVCRQLMRHTTLGLEVMRSMIFEGIIHIQIPVRGYVMDEKNKLRYGFQTSIWRYDIKNRKWLQKVEFFPSSFWAQQYTPPTLTARLTLPPPSV